MICLLQRLLLKKWNAISPDFIKLDYTKAQGLSYSTVKQQTISLFLEYTNEKTKLVLEGIETDADLMTAKRLGRSFTSRLFYFEAKTFIVMLYFSLNHTTKR